MFNEQNVHAQCKSCNGFWEGEQAKYQEHLLEKYGQDLVDYLWSHKHTERKYPIFELLELEEHYKLKVKQIMSSLP